MLSRGTIENFFTFLERLALVQTENHPHSLLLPLMLLLRNDCGEAIRKVQVTHALASQEHMVTSRNGEHLPKICPAGGQSESFEHPNELTRLVRIPNHAMGVSICRCLRLTIDEATLKLLKEVFQALVILRRWPFNGLVTALVIMEEHKSLSALLDSFNANGDFNELICSCLTVRGSVCH